MAKWQPGQSGNISGRSSIQQRLDQAFRRNVFQMWREHGQRCLEQMIANRPEEFCKLVASMLPRQTHMEINRTETKTIDLADAVQELEQLADRLGLELKSKPLPHHRTLDAQITLPAKSNSAV